MSVVTVLRKHLRRGDLTCILCDHGVALPLPGPWPVRFGAVAFAGLVSTAHLPAGEVGTVDRAIDDLPPGAALLLQSESASAVWGGRLTARALAAGAAGVVVVGCVRDVQALEAGRLPLIARGVAPHRSDAPGSGAVDATLHFDDLRVHPGDALVVDANGVVVVPQARFDAVASHLRVWVHEEQREDTGDVHASEHM